MVIINTNGICEIPDFINEIASPETVWFDDNVRVHAYLGEEFDVDMSEFTEPSTGRLEEFPVDDDDDEGVVYSRQKFICKKGDCVYRLIRINFPFGVPEDWVSKSHRRYFDD